MKIFSGKKKNTADSFSVARRSLKIAMAYLAIASLWVVFSNSAIQAFAGNVEKYSQLSQLKGLALVVATTIMLFVLVRRYGDRWKALEEIGPPAHYDDLTGLPNRHRFYQMLEETISSVVAGSKTFGLLHIDIDSFRNYNDRYGHHFADRVISSASERIAEFLGKDDVLVRLGGDEFAVLVHGNCEDHSRLRFLAEMIRSAFAEPLLLSETQTYVSVSMGSCAYPSDARSAKELLQCLDIALYEAKSSGRGSYVRYRPELGLEAKARHQYEFALRNALEKSEFQVYYQPIFDLKKDRIIGAEALVRWNHPELGLVSPADFIDLCEETSIIIPLGRWVLWAACHQARIWQDQFGLPIKMSVNISPKQFADANLINEIEMAIYDSEIQTGTLQVEITEGLLMADPERTAQQLETLKSLGVKIAIDDFGTGYSSLSYLHRYPVDCLKVDRSFVTGVLDDPDAATICRTMVVLAHNLKMSVVAEGVETKAQQAFLRDLGCEMTQGYLYGKPMPSEAFEALLASQNSQSELAA